FFFHCSAHLRDLHSFPTRRSSDLPDDSYTQFGTHVLDRAAMARVNEALAQLGPAAVAYDLIFPLPSTPAADQRFTDSIKQLGTVDRKSTRLNSSHVAISYAVFCLK